MASRKGRLPQWAVWPLQEASPHGAFSTCQAQVLHSKLRAFVPALRRPVLLASHHAFIGIQPRPPLKRLAWLLPEAADGAVRASVGKTH